MTDRQCRDCRATKPLDAFPQYSSNGYTGHRHVCRDCVRLYRTRWEMNLTPDKAAEYNARKAETDRAHKERVAAIRKADYRERRKMLRALVTSLLNDGMTRKMIAELAGVNERTVRRILKGTDRVTFYEPTEAKIMALYAEVKGIAA